MSEIWKKGEHDTFVAEWATLKHIKDSKDDNLDQAISELERYDPHQLPPLKPGQARRSLRDFVNVEVNSPLTVS